MKYQDNYHEEYYLYFGIWCILQYTVIMIWIRMSKLYIKVAYSKRVGEYFLCQYVKICMLKVMHMGTRNAETSYIMGETIIQTTTEEKDLGVVIDKQLKFHGHVTYAANKANRVLTTIKRTFETRDQETIPLLYKGLVRPLLEYGNTVWSPRYITDIKAVERVQKRATKMITSLRQQPYIDRLRTLKLPSLEYRRRRGDMIQVYKIMYQKDRIDPDTFFQLAESTTRGHELKLNKPRHNTNLRGQIFSHRIVTDWNSLPAEVVRAPSLNSFKARLDRSWTNKKYINPFDK